MIARLICIAALAAAASAGATAQIRLPLPIPGQRGAPPPVVTIDMIRADFTARSGSDTIYFADDGAALTDNARAVLAAQARWLMQNPHIPVRVEGHADGRETRSRAIAVGERRAEAVRDFLILQGVPSGQIVAVSWGKERPKIEGMSPQAIAYNRRAVTVLMPPAAPMLPPPLPPR